jgi:small subunit ribosomal protein S17
MTKKTEKKNTEKTLNTKPKKLVGIVVSTKMKDTIVVDVTRYFKHAKYEKFIKSNKRYKAHDVGNTTNTGDKVEITECRPLSKDKHFILSNVLMKAPVLDLTEDKE